MNQEPFPFLGKMSTAERTNTNTYTLFIVFVLHVCLRCLDFKLLLLLLQRNDVTIELDYFDAHFLVILLIASRAATNHFHCIHFSFKPYVFLFVRVQLALPFVHVGCRLLQRAGQSIVVAFERGQFDFPFLSIGTATRIKK